MKKVLIISYYWPPSGGAGVQRWLKFVKYLGNFAWKPIIYTPENPEYPSIDNSLLKDVPDDIEIITKKIYEPYSAYKKFLGKNKDEKINAGFLSEGKKNKTTENISVWIRGNFFIPDARMLWIKPSIKFLSKYLEKNQVDAIISTGPPHSMHMIAYKLNKKFDIPWLADFRDPWTNIDFYKDLKLTKRADKKHHKLEQKVLKNASRVVVISNLMAQDMNELYNRKYDVVTNGFDYDDIQSENIEKDKKFSISHIGSMVRTRNPKTLWQALGSLIAENKISANHLEIKLVGKVDFSIIEDLKKNNLFEFLNKIDYLPHNQVTKVQQQTQVLLLVINDTPNAKMILTGKFFEYLSAKRPILCVGPSDGEAAKILKDTNSGVLCEYNDFEKTKNSVLQFYKLYLNNNLQSESKNIDRFSRKELTKSICNILDEMQ